MECLSCCTFILIRSIVREWVRECHENGMKKKVEIKFEREEKFSFQSTNQSTCWFESSLPWTLFILASPLKRRKRSDEELQERTSLRISKMSRLVNSNDSNDSEKKIKEENDLVLISITNIAYTWFFFLRHQNTLWNPNVKANEKEMVH